MEIISSIEAKKIYFNSLKIPVELRSKIQRVSLLKSSLFSARIEGNPLELSDMNHINAGDIKKREVFNIQRASNYINSINIKVITKEALLELHRLVLENISPDAGKLRNEASAIFNQAGVAIYLTPPPSDIQKMLENLLVFIKNENGKFPIITAFIAHLIFEKIHPFLDGNGRVGRLLVGLILKINGWDFAFTIPFEEYLDENKEEYYYYLDNGLEKTNDYLLFILNAFFQQTKKTQLLLENEIEKKQHIFLPPRQEEILNIIKDHSVASFDMIKRRFLKVPARTLRYDIKKLIDQGLVEKTGTTKGVYYRVK